ncbi:GFA family protein [Arenimonas fontis]|uniref:GFA family protein n=1 Tax=Arenimonas fontis TaxID=2608255 RepID=A0A5B2ZC82_9GAMM|nr:GFA family protein [Arenimonas fontis]KAA2286288.1 GFA family protein [Arenimonas fontis]
MTTHTGSCHCGRIAFEVHGEIRGAIACNCSICRRKGSLLWFVPREALRLRTPEQDIATYTFNRHEIRHRFCPVCGMHPFGEGSDPETGRPMAAINLRCLDDLDLDAVTVQHFDGRSL